MSYRIFYLPIIALLFSLLVACKPGVPDGVLSERKMENVLYDYHLAQGLAMQHSSDSVDYYTRLLQQAVFRKHGIDEETFDRSMEWYARHNEQLNDIYKRLAERSGDVSGSTGGGANAQLASGAQSLSGDSLNLWSNTNYALLNSKGVNRFTFTVEADTAIKASDMLQWKFFVDWHYHEGARQAEAVLAVEYEGDSVSVTNCRIFTSGIQTVTLHTSNLKVKRVSGWVYQNAPWAERPRMMTLSNFRLLRIRKQATESIVNSELRPLTDDSLDNKKLNLTPQQRMRDSLLRHDTLHERKAHFR